MSYIDLRGAVGLTHLFLRERLGLGDRVVDATCGNGQDTLFVARLVGPPGRVWAFDIQEPALSATRALLADNNCLRWVNLVKAGHERLAELVDGQVQAVVFNLGYLPGGDKACVTRPDSTLTALEQATAILVPGGIIVITIYTGHPGGTEEGAAVEAWAATLLPRDYIVWRSRQANQPPIAPYVLLIEKVIRTKGQ
jgi:ubiquinone/menaquinone biosynthesis C-methylase UbiE